MVKPQRFECADIAFHKAANKKQKQQNSGGSTFSYFYNPATKKKYRGVHKVIKKWVPKYNKRAAIYDATPATQTKHVYPVGYKRKGLVKNVKQGKSRGSRLDKQLTRTLEIHQAHPGPDTQRLFYDTAYLNKYVGLTKAERTFLKSRSYMREVRMLWAWCHQQQLLPIQTQASVCSTALNIGTDVDLICEDAQKRYVLVECKNGYIKYLYHHTGNRMLAPFTAQYDHAYNQMHQQLLTNLILFQNSHPHHRESPTHYVFRVDPHFYDVYPLEQWAVKHKQEYIQALQQL